MSGTSGRNGPLTGNDGKVSARPATQHRETAAKGVNTCDTLHYKETL